MLKLVFIIYPKRPGATEGEDLRTTNKKKKNHVT